MLDGDTDIDDLENQIDEATLNILARTQPVARDLRFLMSVVRMVLIWNASEMSPSSSPSRSRSRTSRFPPSSKRLSGRCVPARAPCSAIPCSPSRTETPPAPLPSAATTTKPRR
ncbi:MAG: PhoU domain-containing protein [Bilophila wadsworthia]